MLKPRKLRTRIFDLMYFNGYRSQADLAGAMGIDPGTLSRVKSGEFRINEPFMERALVAFRGKSWDDLFYWDDDEVEAGEAAGVAGA